MKMTLRPILGAALLAALSTQALAQNAQPNQQISYNYAGLQYLSQKLDDFNCTQDGLSLYGSMDLNSGWFAQAAYSDVSGGGCGSSSLRGQGGYRTGFNDIFYLYGTVGFESISPDQGSSDSGLVAAGGLRGFIKPNIETQFELAHTTAGDGETTLSAGGSYWLESNIAVTSSITLGADATTFTIGGRINF